MDGDDGRLDQSLNLMEMPHMHWMWRMVSTPDARVTLGLLALLIAAGSVSPAAYRYHPTEDTTLKKVFRTLQKRGLNREAEATQTAGYYEGLLDQAANVARVSGRSWLDWRYWFVERAQHADRRTQYMRNRKDFLKVELRPNVDVPDVDERRRTVTNSHGMMDREYAVTPPADVWRIALIGDSVSQGVGAEFGASYEAKLEEYLNRRFSGRKYQRYEILNFSVRGYQLTQLVEVARERVPAFAPHLYVVALTERSVFTVWADHLAWMVRSGIDLKYEYLKQVARETGLTPNLSAPLINARLAPYRDRIFRWALEEIKAQAARAGVELVVLLVPTANDPETQILQFQPAKRALEEMSIHTVDLLDTFAYLEDRSPIEVRQADKHPNDAGHQMLFEGLRQRLERDAGLMRIVTGSAE